MKHMHSDHRERLYSGFQERAGKTGYGYLSNPESKYENLFNFGTSAKPNVLASGIPCFVKLEK